MVYYRLYLLLAEPLKAELCLAIPCLPMTPSINLSQSCNLLYIEQSIFILLLFFVFVTQNDIQACKIARQETSLVNTNVLLCQYQCPLSRRVKKKRKRIKESLIRFSVSQYVFLFQCYIKLIPGDEVYSSQIQCQKLGDCTYLESRSRVVPNNRI